MHGQFCWYDLITTDPAAAKRYYMSVFGWKTQSFPHASPDNPYDMWAVGDSTFGGVGKLSMESQAAAVPPHWISSVHVNNVDETVRKATSLGGRLVTGPQDIPQTGRYAVIEDPHTAKIAIFQSNGPWAGFDGTAVVGKPSWHELMTTDYRAAFDFYRQLFGWEKTSEMDMGPLGMYLMYGMKGKPFGGIYNRPPEMGGMHPFWLPYFHVKDLKASTAAATKAGGTVVNGPMEVPGGDWIVVMGDPQNAAFAMHMLPTKAAVQKTAKKAVKTAKKVVKTAKKVVKKAKKVVKKAKSAMKKKPKAKPRTKAKKKAKRR